MLSYLTQDPPARSFELWKLSVEKASTQNFYDMTAALNSTKFFFGKFSQCNDGCSDYTKKELTMKRFNEKLLMLLWMMMMIATETRLFSVCIIHWRFIKLNDICFLFLLRGSLFCYRRAIHKLHKIKANVCVDTSHQQRKYPEV